jgi:Rad/Gem-related GTP binding protein 1
VTVLLEGQESELEFLEAEEEGEFSPDCECVLVVFSVTDRSSLREAKELLQRIWQCGDLNTKAVIVVGNKTDLVRTREVTIDGKWNN